MKFCIDFAGKTNTEISHAASCKRMEKCTQIPALSGVIATVLVVIAVIQVVCYNGKNEYPPVAGVTKGVTNMIESIPAKTWKADLPAFREQTAAFYKGKVSIAAYKGFSGYYGSYAQKGGKASMLRLRMPAGRVTKDKLAFIAQAIRDYQVPRVHFTTCETIQLHDLSQDTVCALMEKALDAGIVPIGGGGDFPRNVMCSPLSGTEQGEYFDVMPWALAAAQYLMHFIKAEKMPRKLKVCFSNSPANVDHATYRDLGFVARKDGKFDVYSAGGLGNNPRFGVLVAEGVPPEKILYYIKAMWLNFRAHGNYQNRGKARTRYMQESLGSLEAYRKAFLEKLEEVKVSGEDLGLAVQPESLTKQGDGTTAAGPRVTKQKQLGLYTVAWHPLGGKPAPETFCALSDLLQGIDAAEMRLAPDETAYLINLTGKEAQQVLKLTAGDTAQSLFETSVSCIGASICQVGLRDSQALLAACVEAVRAAHLPDGALPQIHISGCPSSCGSHQTNVIGFRGAVKRVDGKPQPAFLLCVGGCALQGHETMGRELGTIIETKIPQFLVEVGKAAAAAGKGFATWYAENPAALEQIAAPYLA
ncbi:MAG: nitrite/sulfite reductase [Oscillospiraceae bacterium]|nr:nitrite/sulfite reductase [Oscillospiraceae bacterium]